MNDPGDPDDRTPDDRTPDDRTPDDRTPDDRTPEKVDRYRGPWTQWTPSLKFDVLSIEALTAGQTETVKRIARDAIARAVLPKLQGKRLAEALIRSVGINLGPAIRQLVWSNDQLRETVRRVFESIPRDWYPPNWGELGDNIDFDAALRVMTDEGIPLVWVPSEQLVRALVQAPNPEARIALLAARRLDIASHCLDMTAAATAPELAGLVTATEQTIEALKAHLWMPAQALACNVVDTLLRDVTTRACFYGHGTLQGRFSYGDAVKELRPVTPETGIGSFRLTCVLSPLIPLLATFDPANPPPPELLRHATAHRVDPVQYSEANSVLAVMIMTSMLREAQAQLEATTP